MQILCSCNILISAKIERKFVWASQENLFAIGIVIGGLLGHRLNAHRGAAVSYVFCHLL
jgi:hypothetical protein